MRQAVVVVIETTEQTLIVGMVLTGFIVVGVEVLLPEQVRIRLPVRNVAHANLAAEYAASAGFTADGKGLPLVKAKFSRQNNLTNLFVVQASRLLENAGGTPAPQGANQSIYCDACLSRCATISYRNCIRHTPCAAGQKRHTECAEYI